MSIPAKRNWLVVLFVGAWLCGWAMGLVFAVTALFVAAEPLPARVFLMAWLTMWTLGGGLALVLVGWQVAGRELIALTPDDLTIRLAVGSFGYTRTYDVPHVSALRFDGTPPTMFGPKAALGFWGLGAGRIAFDYGASTVRFGNRVDEPEVRTILQSFEKRVPCVVEPARVGQG